MSKFLNVIVACAENRVIGREGKIPWQIPEDRRFFDATTAGHPCILGRICFESWRGAALEGRRPIVLASRPPGRGGDAGGPPAIVVRTLTEAIAAAESIPGEIHVCGGQRIYEETLALPRPIRLLLTLVHATVPGDRFFPEWRRFAWRETARRESADAHYRYTFLTLEM